MLVHAFSSHEQFHLHRLARPDADANQTNDSWQDLRLALALAESVSQPIPTVAAANELYKAAKSLGLADHDFSAVIEALKAKVENSQK